MTRPVLSCLLLSATFLVSPLHAQRELKDIPDPDPEIERKSFQVAEGFEVNLYAADPRIAKPIQMNFDARGRLWIASSSIYPHIEPGQEANDRILVIDDTDGDGVADSTTVFAEGLLIPTGVEPGDGGAYVANSTEFVHFRDEDGDGKADSKRVLLSGFGTEDTHHILHTFRWGMDGMLYFNQSIYIHSHIETPWGVRRLGGGGIWQFRPETQQLEILCRGFVNTWGHHFDDWGQSFASDGAYGEGVNYVFPGSVWVTAPGATRIMKGLNPGSPKHCGLEVLSGSHLPESWRGNIILNDFRGHRVCRFVITEDGSGFASREQPEVIKTEHVAFRPIDVKVGPDGAIYIADWYNPIIQHGEVDFRDPRRDHTHGRIWRITAKGRPLVKRPKLVGAKIPELLDSLKSPEYFTRHQAKRVLKELGAEKVLPELEQWLAVLPSGDAQSEHHRLEGLWTSQSLDVVSPKLVADLLQATDHRARAAAVRVVSQWHKRLPDALAHLARAVNDDHPRVRLEAVRALAGIPGVRSAELAFQALNRPMDANIDFALWQAARDLQNDWLPAVQKGEADFGGNAQHLTFALQSIGSPAVVAPLVGLLKSGKIPPGREESALTLIAGLGGPAELRLVYDLALADGKTPERRPLAAKLLAALNDAALRRKIAPEGDLSSVVTLFGTGDELDAAAARAAGYWKVEVARSRLVEQLRVAMAPSPASQAALEGLALLGGPETEKIITELAGKGRAYALRSQAIVALGAITLPNAARQAVDLLAESTSGDDPTPIYSFFWQQKQGPAEFVTALGDKKLPEDTAKLGVRLARIAGRDLGEAIAALSKAGGLTGSEKLLNPQQMGALVAAVKSQGDPVRGEQIFRRAEALCLKCHAISGAGGQVGPDLGSIGASAQVDYLIDSLLVPNKAVKENYHSVVIETTSGKVVTGIKVRQTETDLVLRNAEDQEFSVPISEIEEQTNGGSIMPAGLIDTLTQGEMIDLIRFLSELGKVGAYAPSQARVARRWQVLDPATPGLKPILASNPTAIVTHAGLTWQPFYSRVSGALPIAELPTVVIPNGQARVSFVRAQIDVTTGGQMGLTMQIPAGTSLWLDGKSLEPTPKMAVDLAPGQHTVLFRVEGRDPAAALRLELEDVAGSSAQARFSSGK